MSGYLDLGMKVCEHCGATFQRRRINGRMEDAAVFKRRKYCSRSCANSRKHPTHWETYHYRARKFRKDSCEACGQTKYLHAHHADGNPENNTADNIQTLCVYCHNFLHATAERRGWPEPGRLPCLVQQTA